MTGHRGCPTGHTRVCVCVCMCYSPLLGTGRLADHCLARMKSICHRFVGPVYRRLTLPGGDGRGHLSVTNCPFPSLDRLGFAFGPLLYSFFCLHTFILFCILLFSCVCFFQRGYIAEFLCIRLPSYSLCCKNGNKRVSQLHRLQTKKKTVHWEVGANDMETTWNLKGRKGTARPSLRLKSTLPDFAKTKQLFLRKTSKPVHRYSVRELDLGGAAIDHGHLTMPIFRR